MLHVLLTDPPRVGEALRRLRERRDLSIATVARRVGVSASYLQQIETGGRTASWVLAWQVCHTLGSTLLRMLESIDPPPPPRDGVHFLGEHLSVLAGDLPDARGLLPDPPTEPTLALRIPADSSAALFDLRLPPHTSLTDRPVTLDGTLLLTGIRGRLLLELDGDEHDLRPGHSARFNASRPHTLRNYTDTPCSGLMILLQSRE